MHAYRPSPDLESVLLVRGNSDRSLLDAALAEANAAELDDQMVLELGCGPARVRLLDHPEYPSCVRYANALCTDGNLATYGAGEYQACQIDRWVGARIHGHGCTDTWMDRRMGR